MQIHPRPVSAYAPYDPNTGRIYADKIAERAEDVPVLAGCIVIAVTVQPRAEAIDGTQNGAR